jgi:hypothetical protein
VSDVSAARSAPGSLVEVDGVEDEGRKAVLVRLCSELALKAKPKSLGEFSARPTFFTFSSSVNTCMKPRPWSFKF